MNRARPINNWSIGVILAIMAFMVAGCATVENPARDSLTGVQVEGRTPEQIRNALQAVFQEKGYAVVKDSSGQGSNSFEMVFQRKASRKNAKAYGTWMSTWHDNDVVERLIVKVSRLSTGPYTIGLDALMVSDPNDTNYTEEHKLTWMTSGTYRRLLEEVKERLKK